MTFVVVALQLLALVSTPRPQGPPQNIQGPPQGPPKSGHYEVSTVDRARDEVSTGDGGHDAAPSIADPANVACTFDHPDYAGQCVENTSADDTQTPRQACEVILSCLNNPRCVKTYCQSTTLRGGWKLVSAEPADR